MLSLVIGALVRWPGAPSSAFGVVVGEDVHRLWVRFDGEDEPRVFSSRAGVIERIELAGMVRRASNGKVGMVHALTTSAPPRWQVFLDGRIVVVAESDLRPHVLEDPRSRMLEGRLGTARQFALAVTARRYELEHQANDLVTLGDSRVAIKPHQVSVVHRVITNYPHRFLLCDEVGLGKTIEAGMVLKELRARGGAARTLVIAPPNLVRQWQFELKSKFNEAFSILNTDTVRYLRSALAIDDNPFEVYDSVIVSSSWVTGDTWRKLAAEASWDMVIVDEAHHARVSGAGGVRRESNRLYKVVRELVSPDAFSKRAALFLSATPMQLHSSELYALVELLDPALFPTEEQFDKHRREVPGLSRLVHDLQEHGFPIPGEDGAAVVRRVASWLNVADAEAERLLTSGAASMAQLCDDLSARHLLSEILIRNRKKIVGGFMPRQAHRWEVELTEEECQALAAVERYVRDGYARATSTNNAAVGFVMVIFQKLMASSIRALRTSLERRRERLESKAAAPVVGKASLRVSAVEERLDDDVFVGDVLEGIAAGYMQEAAELKRLVELLDAVQVDSKADALVSQLEELRTHEPAAKVLLFTQFRETQEYLRARLDAIGWDVEVFHGQLGADTKDSAVDRFRASTGPSIMLSTEAGGEGRNFQFCHLLVNYDLPWNPMRVEQRIGRLDRIGQTDIVQVFNLWVRGTIEERVLNVLERRINVFEETVGGLDPILGDTERDLKKIFQLGGEQRDAELRRFEELLERDIVQAREAEEKLRDFIMETKSYSKEIATVLGSAATVAPADMEKFGTRLLADVNTYLNKQDDGSYEIAFHEPFLSDYPRHTRDHLRFRRVALRPDVKPDSEHVEYFGLGHPVIDDLVARVTSPSYDGSAAAFEIEADEDLGPTAGWLLVLELGVPALREVRELAPFFVHDSGAVDSDLGHRLVARAGQCPNDHALSPTDVPTDSLDAALDAATTAGFERLQQLEARRQGRSPNGNSNVKERSCSRTSITETRRLSTVSPAHDECLQGWKRVPTRTPSGSPRCGARTWPEMNV